MNFTFEPQSIPEVILVKPIVRGDARGFFLETYRASQYHAGGILDDFLQDNHSRSVGNTLRGLHFQIPPAAHAKLVRVVVGSVLDVAVDIRRGSPTYGQWVGARLSAENHQQLYVPIGFAHGFYVLSDNAEVVYKISGEYSPEHDRGIRWDDPALDIDWGTTSPLLSERDKKQPTLAEAETGFVYKENLLEENL